MKEQSIAKIVRILWTVLEEVSISEKDSFLILLLVASTSSCCCFGDGAGSMQISIILAPLESCKSCKIRGQLYGRDSKFQKWGELFNVSKPAEF